MVRRYIHGPVPPRRGRRLFPSPPSSVYRPPLVSTPTPPSDASEQDHFNAPLYSLKAFTFATAIVMSTAAASVAAVTTYLDVRDTTEFAARMRTWVSQSMPLLTAKIYRPPTSRDAVEGDPILVAVSTPQASIPTTFDHDAAQQRLADAFDRGGLDTWAEAIAREMEAEIEVERARRGKVT